MTSENNKKMKSNKDERKEFSDIGICTCKQHCNCPQRLNALKINVLYLGSVHSRGAKIRLLREKEKVEKEHKVKMQATLVMNKVITGNCLSQQKNYIVPIPIHALSHCHKL